MALIVEVRGKKPTWGKDCYFSENATLAGDITMGDDCSVWFGAVLRADVDAIRVGNGVNIQDCACVHQTAENALIGMNAVVLDGAEIGEGAIVAAGAVVLHGTKVGPYEIWAGVPARFVKKATPEQAANFAQHYLEIKGWYV